MTLLTERNAMPNDKYLLMLLCRAADLIQRLDDSSKILPELDVAIEKLRTIEKNIGA